MQGQGKEGWNRLESAEIHCYMSHCFNLAMMRGALKVGGLSLCYSSCCENLSSQLL